jgi:SIR2-like domain
VLREALVEIVQSRRAFAFIGSGASVEAGAPTWPGLVDQVLQGLDPGVAQAIRSQRAFQRAFQERHFSQCFSCIEVTIGRGTLEERVRASFATIGPRTQVISKLADWPFDGYITTNYDSLLFHAVQEASSTPWIQVGNTDDECRLVSGDARNVVWHIHGCFDIADARSRLILTEEDYGSIYRPGSVILDQLHGLLAQRRIVFIGFGFADREVARVLKRVGLLTAPSKPLFAFVAREGELAGEDALLDLRKYSNVDTLPYRSVNGDHSRLLSHLDLYGSFLVRRSIPFSEHLPPAPEYDPEATGLLIYNELCLRGSGAAADTLELLIRSRVMARVATDGAVSRQSLVDELQARAAMLDPSATTRHGRETLITDVIAGMVKDDQVKVDSDGNYSLTAQGRVLTKDKVGTVKRLTRQFAASMYKRAFGELSDREGALRVAMVANAFIRSCAVRRSLGIALALNPSSSEHSEYQVVALLQGLHQYMRRLDSEDEAAALSRVVRRVLAAPDDLEREFIGLALQASFGAHLLGYDPSALRARRRIFAQTVFLIDANTLIDYLAIGSPGNEAARFLMGRLKELDARLVTTSMLIAEVGTHARWALARCEPGTGAAGAALLQAATGVAGQRDNAFVQGFVAEVAAGRVGPNLWAYLGEALGMPRLRGICSNDDIRRSLARTGIRCLDLSEWEGFDDELSVQTVGLQAQIARERIARNTYTREEQAQAEAEAVVIVESVRAGRLKLAGETLLGAQFVSNTRLIDDIRRPSTPITIRSDSVLHWSSTLVPCGPDELRVFTSELLGELSRSRASIVDARTLRLSFSPVVTAARQELKRFQQQHAELVADYFGEDPEKAFSDIPDVELPDVVASLNAQRAVAAEARVAVAQTQLVAISKRAVFAEAERTELERLRANVKTTKRREASRKRSDAARPKRRRKPG